jgi:uncharacterized protein YciI
MSPSAATPDHLHLLVYDYVDDIVERRPPHREGHLDHAQRARDAGRLVMGGAIGDPPTGGVLVFRVDDPAEVEAFAAEDPYVVNGLVTSHRVLPWTVVV